MESPEQFTIGTKQTHNNTGLTSDPTQVTIGATYTHNSMDTDTKTNWDEENSGEKGNCDGDDTIDSPKNLGLGCASRHVEAIIIILSVNTEEPPPPII